MRWLLSPLFTFSTSGAWAGNCGLSTSYIQEGIEGYDTYISGPVTLSGTLALRGGIFTNDDWLFICNSLSNAVITLTGEMQHSTEYNFLVGHEKYKIKLDLSSYNLSGTDLTENISYKLSDTFTDATSISYAISKEEATGRSVIIPGQVFTVSYKFNLGRCQSRDKEYTNTLITYIYHIILQVNVMTRGFESPAMEISMGEYSFIDIKQGIVAYHPEVIYIDCRRGESGVLRLTPDKIEYSLRSAPELKNDQMLANDEELSTIGTGEVGFHVQDASGADIQYDNGCLYETSQEAVHGKNPITLNIEPVKYDEDIRVGGMKNRAIIVVNNN